VDDQHFQAQGLLAFNCPRFQEGCLQWQAAGGMKDSEY